MWCHVLDGLLEVRYCGLVSFTRSLQPHTAPLSLPLHLATLPDPHEPQTLESTYILGSVCVQCLDLFDKVPAHLRRLRQQVFVFGANLTQLREKDRRGCKWKKPKPQRGGGR